MTARALGHTTGLQDRQLRTTGASCQPRFCPLAHPGLRAAIWHLDCGRLTQPAARGIASSGGGGGPLLLLLEIWGSPSEPTLPGLQHLTPQHHRSPSTRTPVTSLPWQSAIRILGLPPPAVVPRPLAAHRHGLIIRL